MVHFGFHGILYHEYLERTTPEQRTVYYEQAMLRNLKQGYWNTPPDKRAQYGLPEIPQVQKAVMLDQMIEESIRKAREKRRQEEQERLNASSQSGAMSR